MPEVTLKAIEQLLDQKLDQKLEPINTRLSAIEDTLAEHTQKLNRHTTQLDGLAKNVKTLLEQKAVTDHRFERLENWAQKVGPKVGIKLEV